MFQSGFSSWISVWAWADKQMPKVHAVRIIVLGNNREQRFMPKSSLLGICHISAPNYFTEFLVPVQPSMQSQNM
jgi:hypothetical protein